MQSAQAECSIAYICSSGTEQAESYGHMSITVVFSFGNTGVQRGFLLIDDRYIFRTTPPGSADYGAYGRWRQNSEQASDRTYAPMSILMNHAFVIEKTF